MFQHPRVNGNAWLIVAVSLMLFPKLALGLSGFETGVAVMPLVKGDADLSEDDWESIHSTRTGRPAEPRTPGLLEGRIRNTRKLLRTAAVIMSIMLITSSIVTTTLIPAGEVPGGRRGKRTRDRIPGPSLLWRHIRNCLRPQHDCDSLVCRRFGDGRAAKYRSALSTALRHGAAMGAGHAAAGAGLLH